MEIPLAIKLTDGVFTRVLAIVPFASLFTAMAGVGDHQACGPQFFYWQPGCGIKRAPMEWPSGLTLTTHTYRHIGLGACLIKKRVRQWGGGGLTQQET
ncbi:MAG: hypothetical protein COA75_02610 [Cellvibrionales bacterium]|nr:MAG: hypothetical protein COA75_02610 [Cellvibrionales bacterium]